MPVVRMEGGGVLVWMGFCRGVGWVRESERRLVHQAKKLISVDLSCALVPNVVVLVLVLLVLLVLVALTGDGSGVVGGVGSQVLGGLGGRLGQTLRAAAVTHTGGVGGGEKGEGKTGG